MSSRVRALPTRGPRRRAMLREQIGTDDVTAAELLDVARQQRQAAQDLQAALLVTASRWALAHVVDPTLADSLPGREGAAQVTGDGAPLVAEFCLAEFAANLGMSTDAGRGLLGDAVELAHRLPRT